VEQARKQYESLLSQLRDVQFQLAEGLADSWSLVNPKPAQD